MTPQPMTMLLIPGAWMGAWIWLDTIERLRQAGHSARSLTLTGLDADTPRRELASVRLSDHVGDVLTAVQDIDGPLTIVGHSYSGLIAGMVADQAADLVAHTVIVAGFFPRHGRSLLDDWGSSADERSAERVEIEEAGMVWAPPPVEGLAADPGLNPDQAGWLHQRLVPHPGHTVLEPAVLQRSIAEQSVTVVADVGAGDPRSTLPDDLADENLDTWEFRSIPAGHWPMISHPERLVELLIEAATTAASQPRS